MATNNAFVLEQTTPVDYLQVPDIAMASALELWQLSVSCVKNRDDTDPLHQKAVALRHTMPRSVDMDSLLAQFPSDAWRLPAPALADTDATLELIAEESVEPVLLRAVQRYLGVPTAPIQSTNATWDTSVERRVANSTNFEWKTVPVRRYLVQLRTSSHLLALLSKAGEGGGSNGVTAGASENSAAEEWKAPKGGSKRQKNAPVVSERVLDGIHLINERNESVIQILSAESSAEIFNRELGDDDTEQGGSPDELRGLRLSVHKSLLGDTSAIAAGPALASHMADLILLHNGGSTKQVSNTLGTVAKSAHDAIKLFPVALALWEVAATALRDSDSLAEHPVLSRLSSTGTVPSLAKEKKQHLDESVQMLLSHHTGKKSAALVPLLSSEVAKRDIRAVLSSISQVLKDARAEAVDDGDDVTEAAKAVEAMVDDFLALRSELTPKPEDIGFPPPVTGLPENFFETWSANTQVFAEWCGVKTLDSMATMTVLQELAGIDPSTTTTMED